MGDKLTPAQTFSVPKKQDRVDPAADDCSAGLGGDPLTGHGDSDVQIHCP
jgi:hypothetical protein